MTIRELRILPPFASGGWARPRTPLDNFTIVTDWTSSSASAASCPRRRCPWTRAGAISDEHGAGVGGVQTPTGGSAPSRPSSRSMRRRPARSSCHSRSTCCTRTGHVERTRVAGEGRQPQGRAPYRRRGRPGRRARTVLGSRLAPAARTQPELHLAERTIDFGSVRYIKPTHDFRRSGSASRRRRG